MCEGETVKLACGHSLIHFRRRCEKKCASPAGKEDYIQDSCSQCHILPDVIRKRYEELHEETQEEYRRAHREGRFDDLHELERVMRARRVNEFQELSEARRRGRSCPRVVWPGCRDEDQYVPQDWFEDWSFLPPWKRNPRPA